MELGVFLLGCEQWMAIFSSKRWGLSSWEKKHMQNPEWMVDTVDGKIPAPPGI